MKKRISLLLLASICLLLIVSCNKSNHETDLSCQPTSTGCFKGRLEIKGLCANLTIKVLDHNFPDSLVQNGFQNPKTGETLNNVFAVRNICDFPSSLNEGDEFYFSLTSGSKNWCAWCDAYYPKPKIAHDITVLSAPCN